MNLGAYQILDSLGPGCPGDWYRARAGDAGLGVRILVCWDPDRETVAWETATRRLRVLAKLDHPAVIPILELHLDHQPPFVVAAEPKGEALADIIKRVERWPEQEVLEIGARLADALAAAHRLGMTHGALTAAHIWLEEENRCSVDFASSPPRPVVAEAPIDPQQAATVHADLDAPTCAMTGATADILALGTILHQLVHGTLTITGVRSKLARDIETVVSLTELLEMMTARDADARPSAAQVLTCLRRFMGEAADQLMATGAGAVSIGLGPRVRGVPPAPGLHTQIGRFCLRKKLGEGGLGVVYLAEDSADGKQVALKVLHPYLTANEASVRRFRKEARMLAEVKSEYVCRLIDFNNDHGVHYLVMEFLEGQSLGAYLEKHKRLTERVALALTADVARALAEAHRNGVVHRDVKPDNIMLIGPWEPLLEARPPITSIPPALRVKLCDFGLARPVDQSASLALTHTGQFIGTPLYMSPEQAQETGEVTRRSDVYSLGATLFHVLTGRPPFQANSIAELYTMHLKEEAASPQIHNADLSSAVCLIVQKALAKNPLARYADADDFLSDLERTLRGEPTTLVSHPHLPADAGQVLEYDWILELEASPAQLWPLVSNTERFNQAVGLPSVQYALNIAPAEEPSLLSRAERMGTFRKGGVENTWREHPFEWVEGRRMGILREYSQGVFKWMASTVELKARADGGTTLHHRVRLVPSGIFGRVVAAIEVGFRGRRAVEKVYRRMDAYLTHKLPDTPSIDPFVSKAASPVKDSNVADRLVGKLTARGVSAPVAAVLVHFALKAPEQEVARIRPIALAQRFNVDAEAMIDACLIAAVDGILDLLWDILCPKCRIPSAIEETMRNIRSHGRCEACNLDFELDFANSVELIFRVHPTLRPSEPAVYCAGGPAHSPHVAAQVRVAASERMELALNLAEGSYRLRGPQLSYALDFRVHPEARATRGALLLLRGPTADFPRTFGAGAQTILLTNDHTAELVVRVERLAPRADALTAFRVSSLPRFRDLFPHEVLSGNQLVSVSQVTFLATDLDGAADLYQRLGDARAFGVLHEHFRIMEDHIRRESGALVKTQNEGILATFHDSAAAVRVALDLQGLLAKNAATRDLRLRVGVHRGFAMVATINGKLDYFGTAVKLAQTLPTIAAGKEVVLTQPLVSDQQVQSFLMRRGLTCTLCDAALDVPIYRLTLAPKVEPPRLRQKRSPTALTPR